MGFYFAFIRFLLVASLCDAAVVQSRIYCYTGESLVPLANVQYLTEIKEITADLKENETVPPGRNLETKIIAEDIVAPVVDEEQKLEIVEAVAKSQRRIDEVIVEEDLKGAVKKEQDKKKIIQTIETESKLGTSIAENSEIGAVIQPENNEKSTADDAKEFVGALENNLKEKQPVIVILEANSESNDNTEQLKDAVRETATAQPTQQNVVQQLKQNSPFGQFFNQLNGQAQATSDASVPTPATSRPGLFQGLQQFASNLVAPFQGGLGGQRQETEANADTVVRPVIPQQILSNFISNNQQPAP